MYIGLACTYIYTNVRRPRQYLADLGGKTNLANLVRIVLPKPHNRLRVVLIVLRDRILSPVRDALFGFAKMNLASRVC